MATEPVRNFLQTRVADRPHKRWPVLPASLAAHAAAAVAIVVIPLTAEVELPAPAPLSRALHVLEVKPMPVPPPVGGPRVHRTPAPNADAAPVSAPSTIDPEPDVQPSGNAELPPTEGGLPFGAAIGSIGGVPVAGPPPTPPPAPPPPGPVRVGHGIREPKKIHHVPPVYPAIARSAGVQGTVVLEAIIDERGVVDNVRVLRSVTLLDKAAIDAVRSWRYTPTLLSGVPVPVLLTITVNFQLDR